LPLHTPGPVDLLPGQVPTPVGLRRKSGREEPSLAKRLPERTFYFPSQLAHGRLGCPSRFRTRFRNGSGSEAEADDRSPMSSQTRPEPGPCRHRMQTEWDEPERGESGLGSPSRRFARPQAGSPSSRRHRVTRKPGLLFWSYDGPRRAGIFPSAAQPPVDGRHGGFSLGRPDAPRPTGPINRGPAPDCGMALEPDICRGGEHSLLPAARISMPKRFQKSPRESASFTGSLAKAKKDTGQAESGFFGRVAADQTLGLPCESRGPEASSRRPMTNRRRGKTMLRRTSIWPVVLSLNSSPSQAAFSPQTRAARPAGAAQPRTCRLHPPHWGAASAPSSS